MKKKTLNTKLVLAKETIADLSELSMDVVKGGAPVTMTTRCDHSCDNTMCQ